VAALIALDLATSGGAHLTRTVVHGNGIGDILDIVRRRLIISANGLKHVSTAISCGIGIVLVVLGLRRREALLAPLRDQPAFRAGIWGALTATIVGALANDSGPLIFEAGVIMLLYAIGYARGRPKNAAVRPGVVG
jgi:hypothetical protein